MTKLYRPNVLFRKPNFENSTVASERSRTIDISLFLAFRDLYSCFTWWKKCLCTQRLQPGHQLLVLSSGCTKLLPGLWSPVR
ncbi:hypothetical protein J6590_041998 [Homalodisca vitripennis]|nr:hypothetical protein J6590_041998 [Homalodisca vitripennis]